MGHDVFISYSSKDKLIADKVCYILEQNSINCWIAPRNIRSGKSMAEEIQGAVESAKLVVLIGSYNSFCSSFVENEVSLAFNIGKQILPFIIDMSLPRDKMEFYLKNVSWISAHPNPEEKFEELVNSVLEVLDGGYMYVDKQFDAFISYSSMNSDVANAVCDVLENDGIKCWIPPRDLLSGQNYAPQIYAAIKNVKFFVAIASNGYYQSKYAEKEIEMAVSNNKPILAFKIDDKIPKGRMEFYFKNVTSGIDSYPDYRYGLEKLLRSANGLLKSVEDNPIALKRPFKAYEGDKPYIFISYAHKDSDLIFKEIKKFHDEGYPVWYDQGLTAGQEWDEEIEDALMDCSLLVVFISENSMASSNVIDEIKLALSEKIDIVPIYLEDAKLAKGLKLRLSQKHVVFKYNSSEEDYLEQCFKAFDSVGIPKIR